MYALEAWFDDEILKGEFTMKDGETGRVCRAKIEKSIRLCASPFDRFEKEYVELAKERGGVKRSRFNLNPTHVRMLGEALIKFADDNGL